MLDLTLGGITISQCALLALILAASGFISGLTGFGFSLLGIFSLWILDPRTVIPLLMTLSLANQALSLSKLRKSMTPLREWWPYGPAPFILGGLFGVPVGLYLLVMLNPLALDEMIGFALVIYAIWMTFQKSRAILPARHTLLNSGVGFLGGVVGGLVAAPGPPLVVWATLAGLKKEAQRAIVQPFIIAMQVIAIAEYALKGPGLNTEFFLLALVMMPVVLLATQGGVWAFQKIPDQHFQKAVMILLALSGVSLLLKGKMFWIDLFLPHHALRLL
jgi:uncharacterized membrane protein YfcA